LRAAMASGRPQRTTPWAGQPRCGKQENEK
jgi:hypothetical protein